MSQTNLLRWLAGKIADAEKVLKCREDMAATWRTGTNAEWAAAGAIHDSTKGRTLGKKDRIKEAAMHDRIASNLRHELEMFRSVHAVLSSATPPDSEEIHRITETNQPTFPCWLFNLKVSEWLLYGNDYFYLKYPHRFTHFCTSEDRPTATPRASEGKP